MKAFLTPRQLAAAIGVSESSIKRWVDDGRLSADRTAGGHRRIALEEAVRYIHRRGVSVVRPDLLGVDELAAGGAGDVDSRAERLFGCLKTGAAAEARGLLVSSYFEGQSVAQIVDGVLVPAMEKLGELWLTNPAGIFQEHRATQIAIGALTRLRLLLPPPDAGPVAVGGAPEGDRYILPSLAVATVLASEGLRATNLGPETPLSTLKLAAEEANAGLVWLSVSVVSDRDTLQRGIEELASDCEKRGAILVFGGSAAAKLQLGHRDSVHFGSSMAELEALVKGMKLAPTRPPVEAPAPLS